jgi:hypothetical protein
LHTLGRWVLEFSKIASALSRSAAASTYTWQLPTPVSITGTVDSVTTLRMSDAPPRGMRTSTSPRARIRALTDSRESPGTSATASAGRSVDTSPARSASTIAVLDADAEDDPRRSTALPDFKHRPAASAVTLGRPS